MRTLLFGTCVVLTFIGPFSYAGVPSAPGCPDPKWITENDKNQIIGVARDAPADGSTTGGLDFVRWIGIGKKTDGLKLDKVIAKPVNNQESKHIINTVWCNYKDSQGATKLMMPSFNSVHQKFTTRTPWKPDPNLPGFVSCDPDQDPQKCEFNVESPARGVAPPNAVFSTFLYELPDTNKQGAAAILEVKNNNTFYLGRTFNGWRIYPSEEAEQCTRSHPEKMIKTKALCDKKEFTLYALRDKPTEFKIDDVTHPISIDELINKKYFIARYTLICRWDDAKADCDWEQAQPQSHI